MKPTPHCRLSRSRYRPTSSDFSISVNFRAEISQRSADVVQHASTVTQASQPLHTMLSMHWSTLWVRRCRIDPLRFLAGWRKRRLNQAFSFVLVQLDCACVRLLLVSISLRPCACVCRQYIIVFLCVCVGLIDVAVNFVVCRTSASDCLEDRLWNDL